MTQWKYGSIFVILIYFDSLVVSAYINSEKQYQAYKKETTSLAVCLPLTDDEFKPNKYEMEKNLDT